MTDEKKSSFRQKITKIAKTAFAVAPFVMIVIFAVMYYTTFRNVTAEQLLSYTPENIWLAAIVIIAMFSLKSLTFFFPMLAIVTACGMAAPNVWAAVAINTAGIFCMMNLPYLIGKFAQREYVESIISKHKKMESIINMNMSNGIFFPFFLRIINCLPYDVVSLFCGSAGMKWKTYIIGSMLGTLPGTICNSIMGMYISEPLSVGFIAPLAVDAVLALGGGIGYILCTGKNRKKRKENIPE